MKNKFFGSSIEPACQYCVHSAENGGKLLCKNKKAVNPYDSCRKFEYSPLKRTPRAKPVLPDYNPDDFSL